MSETRDELEKQAKTLGVDSPEELGSKEDVKDAVDVAAGNKRPYFFPRENITVVASDLDEATKLLDEKVKERSNG